MDTGIKVVVGIVVALVMLVSLKSCTDCYSEGGTPVRAVVGFACIKNQ